MGREMPMDEAVLEAIVSAVAGSRKYRAVCPDTIRRIARRELAHHSDAQTALKATKRRLHQVYAAYEEPLDYDAAYARLAAACERSAGFPACVAGTYGLESLPHDYDAAYARLAAARERSAGFPACVAGPYGLESLPHDYDAAYARLAAARERSAGFPACVAGPYGLESLPQVRAVCRDLLTAHSSTRERLPILDEFYPPIWAVTGRPTVLLDLACGLNPLTIPWMDLPPGACYHAYDIDADRVAFLNRALTHLGLRIDDCGSPESAIRNPKSEIHCQDILCQPPDIPADVALLLKTAPCLDRQEPDGARRVLTSLRARFVVVSFAIKSLGGREKGMLAHYEAGFRALADAEGWPVKRLVFATELVFVARKE